MAEEIILEDLHTVRIPDRPSFEAGSTTVAAAPEVIINSVSKYAGVTDLGDSLWWKLTPDREAQVHLDLMLSYRADRVSDDIFPGVYLRVYAGEADSDDIADLSLITQSTDNDFDDSNQGGLYLDTETTIGIFTNPAYFIRAEVSSSAYTGNMDAIVFLRVSPYEEIGDWISQEDVTVDIEPPIHGSTTNTPEIEPTSIEVDNPSSSAPMQRTLASGFYSQIDGISGGTSLKRDNGAVSGTPQPQPYTQPGDWTQLYEVAEQGHWSMNQPDNGADDFGDFEGNMGTVGTGRAGYQVFSDAPGIFNGFINMIRILTVTTFHWLNIRETNEQFDIMPWVLPGENPADDPPTPFSTLEWAAVAPTLKDVEVKPAAFSSASDGDFGIELIKNSLVWDGDVGYQNGRWRIGEEGDSYRYYGYGIVDGEVDGLDTDGVEPDSAGTLGTSKLVGDVITTTPTTGGWGAIGPTQLEEILDHEALFEAHSVGFRGGFAVVLYGNTFSAPDYTNFVGTDEQRATYQYVAVRFVYERPDYRWLTSPTPPEALEVPLTAAGEPKENEAGFVARY